MRIVVAHNFYQQPGGEDQCVAAEVALLRKHGHHVSLYTLHNDQIEELRRTVLASRSIWNTSVYRALRMQLREERPEVVHFHNTFPLISPAAYYAARAEGVVVVQTLHNFRITCANAVLFRNGQICERCVGKFAPWPAIRWRCYRGSRSASCATTAMLAVHRILGTWSNAVDMYVALTEFGRRKFIAAGLPPDRVMVKPNFVAPDPGPGNGGQGYAVFVGRLSTEKGVRVLLHAWRHLQGQVPLRIIGDGPLASMVRQELASDPAIEWMGNLPLDAVYDIVGNARFVVLPSECFEGFPRVVAEAFAKATPVIASRLGAMSELIEDGRTGLHFAPGDPIDLVRAVRQVLADPYVLARMRRAARAQFEENFTGDRNHKSLMTIYTRAIARHAGRGIPYGLDRTN